MEMITFCCKLTFCKWGEAGTVIRSIILLIMACGQGRPISDYIDEFCNLKVMYSILFSTFLQLSLGPYAASSSNRLILFIFPIAMYIH